MEAIISGTKRGSLRRGLSAVLACAVTLALAVCVAAGGVDWAGAADSERLDSLKAKASELSGQEDELQDELDELKNQEASKLSEKAVLEQRISVLSAQIMTSEELIAEYEVQIADKQVELDAAQAEADEYYALFCARVRDMEEKGTLSYWSILFSSASFSDLLDRIAFVSEVVNYDNQIVTGLKAARDAVADAKAVLEVQHAEEAAAKADLERQQEELAEDEAAVEAAIQEISDNAEVYESQLAELQAQAGELEAQIAAAQKEYDAAVAAERAAAGNSSSSSSSSGSGRISMIWPTTSYRITSSFGYRSSPTAGASSYHQGIDIGASKGSPIYAAASGTVTSTGYNSVEGNYVVVAHGSGVSTVYKHCSAIYVSSGQSVSQGQTIAAVGSTGISTGPHLHFGVIEDGSYVNPRNYVG